jgi:hypothetical protein
MHIKFSSDLNAKSSIRGTYFRSPLGARQVGRLRASRCSLLCLWHCDHRGMKGVCKPACYMGTGWIHLSPTHTELFGNFFFEFLEILYKVLKYSLCSILFFVLGKSWIPRRVLKSSFSRLMHKFRVEGGIFWKQAECEMQSIMEKLRKS